MCAGSENVVNDADCLRGRRLKRFIDLIETQQGVERNTLPCSRLVGGRRRLRLNDEIAYVQTRRDTPTYPLDPVVIIGVVARLRTGDRDEGCELEPSGVQ